MVFSLTACGQDSATSKLDGTNANQPAEDVNSSGQDSSTSGGDEGQTGPTSDTKPTGVTTTITEKMYVPTINDIYANPFEYLGNTIDIKGMFITQKYNDEILLFVYRIGPGCCGNDGSLCGFEVQFDGSSLPKQGQWIEVKGILKQFEVDGQAYIRLENASYKPTAPGKEKVSHMQ